MMNFPAIFDSSMMALYKNCPQLFNLQYIQQWKSKELSVHLHAGASFAKAIEATRNAFYVKGIDAENSVALGLGVLLAAYGDFPCPPDSAKSAERMCGAFEFYWSRYPLGEAGKAPITLPGGRMGIEFSFAEPLPIAHPETGDPLIYCGRMDAILNYAGGQFICDEKTTTQLGASWSRQWDLRAQFTGYAWACQKAGIRIDGAIVRGVSILKTKYDTQEAISYRPEWQVDRWYEELLLWLEDIIRDYRKGKFKHNLDHACGDYGGCAFRQVCASQDQQPWLETYFEKRYWNPILRTEEKL
jgi:hypothetical protein